MIKDGEFYFFQEHKQCFIRIKYVDTRHTWENTFWVHYFESVILEDRIELNHSDIVSGFVKESYRKLEYMNSVNSTKATNWRDIQILHKIPETIVEKIKTGDYDKEVNDFKFFSINKDTRRFGGRTYSSPISTLKEYRDYILEKLLTL